MKEYTEFLNKHPQLSGAENDPLRIITDENVVKRWQNQQEHSFFGKKVSSNPLSKIGIIYKGSFIVILRDLVEFPDGSLNGYIRLYNRTFVEEGAVGVAILPKRNNVLLIMHNYRHATRSWHWEIPRGFGEIDTTAEDQAQNEIEEEIGISSAAFVDLGLYHNNTGLEGTAVNLYLAEISMKATLNKNIGADSLKWVEVDELEKMIVNAEITDGFTIAAYTRAKLKELL